MLYAVCYKSMSMGIIINSSSVIEMFHDFFGNWWDFLLFFCCFLSNSYSYKFKIDFQCIMKHSGSLGMLFFILFYCFFSFLLSTFMHAHHLRKLHMMFFHDWGNTFLMMWIRIVECSGWWRWWFFFSEILSMCLMLNLFGLFSWYEAMVIH